MANADFYTPSTITISITQFLFLFYFITFFFFGGGTSIYFVVLIVLELDMVKLAFNLEICLFLPMKYCQ